MKRFVPIGVTLLVGLSGSGPAPSQAKQPERPTNRIPNRLIDYQSFEKIVLQSDKLREKRRLTEKQFLKMMSGHHFDVVVLDARTDKRYEMLHISGAVNLPFTEFTAETLAKIIPSKRTRVLIYCNNNFLGNKYAFAEKRASASLNLSTFTSLMTYGYNNIYELGPLLDVRTTHLPFGGTHADLQKLLLASGDWRSRLENASSRFTLVRVIEGPESPFAVIRETTEATAITLSTLVQSRIPWDSGLLLEDVNLSGRYALAVSRGDIQKYREYLRNPKHIAELPFPDKRYNKSVGMKVWGQPQRSQ